MPSSSSAPFFRTSDMQMQPQGSSLEQNSKKKRNRRPGNPRPDAEVVALSPQTLLATNRFVCPVCQKGFQRDQNLQLHLRGHNMPWKLKPKNPKEACRRVYLCPEPTCVHHDPSRALGDLTGIKKHYSRKHGEKNLKCDKCNKRYAVESDWKAHCKTCGTREYRCECDALFSRKDSFITHRAMCGTALAADRTKTAQMPPPCAGLYVGSDSLGLSGGFADEGQSSSAAEASQMHSFITHRAICDALALKSAQMPPLGAGLYVGTGSKSLGLSGTAAQMHGFAHQASQSSSAAAAVQFDHIMPSSSGSSSMFRSQASASSSSYFLGGGAPPTAQDFSEDCSQGSHQAPLLHGKAPFHGLMQLPEQHHQPGPGSSNNAAFANGNNLLNLGFFSAGNNGGGTFGSQDARLVIQDQFNVTGGGSGSTAEHGNLMAASVGSHLSGGFPSLYNNSSASAAKVQNSATALLMKAAQMGSTSSTTTHTGSSSLLPVACFTGTVSGQGTSRAAEEGMTQEAHFHDLIMNSLPLMGGTGTDGFAGTAGMAGVDDGNLSTRDFLGVGRDDDAMAPTAGLPNMGALDPTQMKWFM
ncbi:protein indeterminate-domain 9 [Sorghum bicolor]|uniref:C2H2-type domain-containing protein n=1 Tax=Sorghum bicolor TaxID=4558 RepID=A0A1B6QE25_SORBI|nr:protein indeterminate-domain 9 [Sorghum bicolor]XP_021308608.1 protein indeterminate-domain 9 [Sorghum bicolor]XP_021308609.1 protein indeterminate-domain 9 [Sorghum bicolor]KXG36162.1 hypothetical protein SORBI_3002G293100 [Sorghum bicolor]KXG36163.1 hypothetical protein SORBI_3002G293100 [Sorghum bicolor]|eukprot:XP_002462814.2 protein indeterminate-domain 9 [Sorghum bicolor]